MTNKNKKIRKLVDRPDSNSALDRYPTERPGNSAGEFVPEIEADAATFDINNYQPKTKNLTKSELEIALRDQSTLIEELNYETEKLRSRRRVLEAELEAREEIGANLSNDLQESLDQLNNAKVTIESRDNDILAMQSLIDDATRRTTRLRSGTTQLRKSSREFKSRIRSLESQLTTGDGKLAALDEDLGKTRNSIVVSPGQEQHDPEEIRQLQSELHHARVELADLRGYIDQRKGVWNELAKELIQIRQQLEFKEFEVTRLSRDLSGRSSELKLSQEQHGSASAQLAQQKAKVRELNKNVRELEHALHHDAELEIAACQARIAEQSGELGALRQELKALRQDNIRIDQYADQLRMQVHDHSRIVQDSQAEQDKTNTRLNVADETIKELSTQLETEKQLNADHTDTIEKMRVEFEREVRQIRFELGTAEETIAGQEALNEQLVSNLIDHQGYRHALETQLSEVEKENEITIQKLTAELKRARHENEDYDRKISIKDSAIADLIQEISDHTSNIEIRGEAENVLQKIDGFRPKKELSQGRDDRGRVARLLIGNADGRELRFPLFKERLTIGRTSHNDIQLNLQYVSRRHAVISTENGETRIIDWGSKNGVFVNRKQVTEHALRSGDTVSIGMADFRYEERNKR